MTTKSKKNKTGFAGSSDWFLVLFAVFAAFVAGSGFNSIFNVLSDFLIADDPEISFNGHASRSVSSIVRSWLKLFLTSLEKIFMKATPETRCLIGCSMFPNGLIFENGDFRTPEIAGCFRLKEGFVVPASSKVGTVGFEPTTFRM